MSRVPMFSAFLVQCSLSSCLPPLACVSLPSTLARCCLSVLHEWSMMHVGHAHAHVYMHESPTARPTPVTALEEEARSPGRGLVRKDSRRPVPARVAWRCVVELWCVRVAVGTTLSHRLLLCTPCHTTLVSQAVQRHVRLASSSWEHALGGSLTVVDLTPCALKTHEAQVISRSHHGYRLVGAQRRQRPEVPRGI